MKDHIGIPCTIMRGGTSKGVFFQEHHLPPNGEERDRFLLKIMGSPDKRQINGLGGATSVTSKVAIVSVSSREDADVDYTFAQVAIDKPIVSYKGNCGNISSAVGPFAIENGLVKITEPITKIRIFNTNTEKVIVAEVNVQDGHVTYSGDYAIAGVPGTAAPIKLNFLNPAGSVTGVLLPTGNPSDWLTVPGIGEVEVSIVDAANPLVFLQAESLGLTGAELPEEMDGDHDLLQRLEAVRGVAAVKIGLIDDYKDSAYLTPGVPKMTIVSKAQDYQTSGGSHIKSEMIDLCSRMMSMQKTHPTYAMTGAMCTAAAAVIKGSVVYQAVGGNVNPQNIRIGHPGGILTAGVLYNEKTEEGIVIEHTFGYRTANLLMKGEVYCNQ